MKILITGRGTSGSWQIRGVQIGMQLLSMGERVTVKPQASVADMREHDIVVWVKRATDQQLADLHRSDVPFVHDIVDAWPQPQGNDWSEGVAKAWLYQYVEGVQADGIICATKAMELDAEHPMATTIYHHARPEFIGTREGDTDPVIMAAGYEGAAHYIASYLAEIGRLCQRHNFNASFQGVASATFALCLRGQSGHAARHWKSNVKLANAQALGIPALCSPESGYQETSTGGVIWINDPSELAAALEALADPAHYAKMCAAVDKPPTLAQCAEQYRTFLHQVLDGR